MGDNFQPAIHIAYGGIAQYPGMLLQGNLQIFSADGTYLGLTNLFQVVDDGLNVAALRGFLSLHFPIFALPWFSTFLNGVQQQPSRISLITTAIYTDSPANSKILP